ncbi:MAG TPA: hypothetical protein VK453_23555 [Micromonosporaceae bacterium]|nr:hypothetical protein [Micromonosporaceae bacterium]
MTRTRKALGVLGAAAAVLTAQRLYAANRPGSTASFWPAQGMPSIGSSTTDSEPRWHSVTINAEPEAVAPGGKLPEPLATLGEAIEVRILPAPGGRGTELHVRLRDGEPSGLAGVKARATGDDPRRDLRAALRNTRQLVETGEILGASQPSTTKRTMTNRVLEYATTHGREEGLL